MPFKAEKTGMYAWQRVIDTANGPESRSVASLDELHNGDWSLNHVKTGKPLVDQRFTNPSRAIAWLNKNPGILND